MRRAIITLFAGACLWASVASAATLPEGPFATYSLVWDYVIGPPGLDAVPTKFIVRCTKGGGGLDIVQTTDALGQPPTLQGRIRFNALLPGPGTYTCTQSPWNAELLEGPASAPFPFVATGGRFVAPSNTRLELSKGE